MNPFQRKFTQWSESLTKKNDAGHAEAAHGEAAAIFEDQPFTKEYRRVYGVAKAGRTLAQVVTFLTTAGLGLFALNHLITADWGQYITVPIALLFAVGIESVKRGTLSIAAKHLLKYKTFGATGVFAVLTLCVSVLFAIWGAKELPEQVYPEPQRITDVSSVAAIEADISRVQKDIERLQSRSADNWTAENRTLPRLQKQRAELAARRDEANRDALARADQAHAEASTTRAAKVEKMQVYAVFTAATAEAVFLACTLFVFYYLFRSYEESTNATGQERPTEQAPGRATSPPATGAANFSSNGTTHANGHNVSRKEDRRETSTRAHAHTHADGNRRCDHCGQTYTHGHARQKFCSEKCRVLNWQERNGKTLRHRINVQ